MSPGGREMVTSGGEREERRAWTPDKRRRSIRSCCLKSLDITSSSSCIKKVK